MAERRIRGRTASGGFAAGPIALLAGVAAEDRASGDPVEEAAALRSAIDAAIASLAALAEEAEGDGAGILAFQMAMLEDEALAAPAFEAIATGAPAASAWRNALHGEIAGYDTADDENFRARASDLRDLRDRVLAGLAGKAIERPPAGAILLGEDLTPSVFLATDWTHGGGIALTRGSASGHVATLARARAIPMLVGLGLDLGSVETGTRALIDGEEGLLWLDPGQAEQEAFAARAGAARAAAATAENFRARPAATADGTVIAVHLNIADPGEIEVLDAAWCDGIGLVRTEFLFQRGLPDEESQYRIYRRLAEWAGGKPVTIRTLDAGADKPVEGIAIEHETNPFLGLRGIRLSLARPAPFRTQLRALARAAVHGAVQIMVPMVAVPDELTVARHWLDLEIANLEAIGAECRRPPLGIMVEVPAAAIAIETFDADFFSIGSNDLTQYVMAAARDNEAVAALCNPTHPAVLRLIERVAAHGAASGKSVSLCGDAGGDPALIASLLRAGLRSLSVAPAALGRTKQAIAAIELSRANG